MHPQARAVDALGQDFRRQRRGDGSGSTRAVASLSVTLAANYSTIDNGFDFDLFDGVGQPKIGQRLAAAITDFSVSGQIDQFLASRQVRVVSSLWRRASRLLSAFLFGCRRILWVIEIIGAIRGGLFLGLFSEAFGLELTNFRLGGIEFGLQLCVSIHRASMHALPVGHITTQFVDFLPQLLNDRRQRPQLFVNGILFQYRSTHSALT